MKLKMHIDTVLRPALFILVLFGLAACSENAAEHQAQESAESTDASSQSNDPVDDADTDETDDPTDPTDTQDGSEADDPVQSDEEDGPLDGFGEITGPCGFLDVATRQTSDFSMYQNAIDFFDDPYDDADLLLLTDGGQEILSDGNAGGSSILSEVFSYEVLARCEGAELLKTENEIIYNDPSGKKTDLLIQVGQSKLGVSVTRAVGYPRDDPYTVETAQSLLEQKLSGVLSSTANVSDADAWSKQILHVVAYAPEHASSLETAYELLSDEVRSDTLVIVTISHGDDEFLY